MKKNLELLAPAQNKECAIAAINFGADAVYMGANAFGARSKAVNSIEDIKDVVDYAHKFYAKVYVTINTILDDKEIIQAQNLIHKLYEIGVDAVIVQDMGLFNLDLPPVKIFASTQCDNRTLEKVKFFENIGVSRVILARELSVAQIEHICKNTNIEVETFIHGALCVSYSGQCYLSCAFGGRSANRGECAQPCRKKYSLVDENGKVLVQDKHLLNLKDFNASKHIDKLVKAGVTSFKIEGRMKDIGYVKNVVGYYRKLLDKYPKSSSGSVFLGFEPKLEKSFNRGFCDYFLEERKKISDFNTPKSLGEKLGIITEVGRDYFKILTDKKLNPQDGLCMLIQEELAGCLVNRADGNKVYPNKMPIADKSKLKNVVVFRNFDSEFEKKLAHSKTVRRIGIKFKVSENTLEVTDEDNNSVELKFNGDEVAQNQEKMAQNFITQLKKCGESDFWVEDVNINGQNLPFLPVSKINELRREILELLMKKRLENYLREMQSPIRAAKYPLSKGDYKLNIHNTHAKAFIEKCGCEIQEFSLESGVSTQNKELMRCKYCIKWTFDICKSKDTLYLLDDKKRRLKLEFDCKNCEMVILNTAHLKNNSKII